MIYHTENGTTTAFGQAIATVIADSICKGKRITTLELVYPRYIHSELMTHRVFSRNASSSRATPIKVLVNEVMTDPVFFDYVGKNKSGMQAGEPLGVADLIAFKNEWQELAKFVGRWAERMSDEYGIHKQTLNRVLEPFSRIRTLVTATEWDNFFKLRISEAAQPEMKNLAVAMQKAMEESTPAERTFHTPYAHGIEFKNSMLITSVARCARVSYARLDGREDNFDDDKRLFDRLMMAGHMSPFEHVATARDGWHANFNGWKSYRWHLEHYGR